VSRRDLAHVLTALADGARAQAGVGVAVTALDTAVGRSPGDMRTPLNLGTLAADGLVEELVPGTWALTDAGVARLREDEELGSR
jgi:hypothetical protein